MSNFYDLEDEIEFAQHEKNFSAFFKIAKMNSLCRGQGYDFKYNTLIGPSWFYLAHKKGSREIESKKDFGSECEYFQ